MSFILIPNIELVIQLYVGLEFNQIQFLDEDIILLYISLLIEFNGNSKFLDFNLWKNFIIGQELLLNNNNRYYYYKDKNINDEYIKFWNLKKEILGISKIQQLYLFNSKNLHLYWIILITSILLLESNNKKSKLIINNEINLYKYYDNNNNNNIGENIHISLEIISLFILFQFIFSNIKEEIKYNNNNINIYSKESYIIIIKFFQRNLSLLLRIISIFNKEEKRLNKNEYLKIFTLFFNKISINDKDNNIEFMKLDEFNFESFNYHIIEDNSNEILLYILLIGTHNVINYQILDNFYFINNINNSRNERITYFITNKVINIMNNNNIINKNEEIIHSNEIKNIIIINSNNLDLYITKPIEILYIRNCNNCNIYGLNLIANINIEYCKDFNLHIDCIFIKLNKCLNNHIFLHSQFSPVILNSQNIIIGPYNIHCINKKTSYLYSYEKNLLNNNWKYPIKINNEELNINKIEYIKPKELFILELIQLDDNNNDQNNNFNYKFNDEQKFPLPQEFHYNFLQRKQNLEIIRKMENSLKEETIKEFLNCFL